MTDTTTKTPEETALQIATDRATKRNELAEVKFGAQGGQLFVPANGRELMDMSNLMAQSGPMVKDIYRGNAGACMALIAICAPYGLNPLQVSWHAYRTTVDGPIAYEAKVIVAMLNASGLLKDGSLDFTYDGSGAERTCTATGTFKNGTVRAVTSPPISGIKTQNSPLWKSDPDQQLAYYTGRAWVRRHRPEMMLGVFSADEDFTAIGPDSARDVTPRPKSGVSYREVDAPAAAETTAEGEGGPEADEAEVVDQVTGEVAGDREAALKAEAARQADRGKDAFVKWWNGLPKDARSLFAPAALAILHAACMAADEAAAETAAAVETTVAADAGDLK